MVSGATPIKCSWKGLLLMFFEGKKKEAMSKKNSLTLQNFKSLENCFLNKVQAGKLP